MEMLGFQFDDARGFTRDAHGAIWNEIERSQLEENLVTRKPFLDFVYSRISSEGTQQYLMVSGEPMFDSTGRYSGYRGIGKDVTDAKLPS